MKYFNYFYSDQESEIQGNGWLIGVDGDYAKHENDFFVTKNCLEIGERAQRREIHPLMSTDLALTWIFVPQAGHFFRIVHQPKNLTYDQINAVAALEKELKSVWNTKTSYLRHGELARIDETWAIGVKTDGSYYQFKDFQDGLKGGDWTNHELTFLMKLEMWMPALTELKRRVEIDPQRKCIQIINQEGMARVYRVNRKDMKRIHDAIYQARRRIGLDGKF